MINNIPQILQSLWNNPEQTSYESHIVNFLNNIFSWEPKQAAATLSLLPKSWVKKNMVVVHPAIIKKFKKYLHNSLWTSKWNEQTIREIDKFFNTINNQDLSNISDYKALFEQWHTTFIAGIQEISSKTGIADLALAEMWIENFLQELAKETKSENQYKIAWAESVAPNVTMVNSNTEYISINNSSWIHSIVYKQREKVAIFKLKTSSKLYVFYSVPRVAINFVETFRGKEMWDGFGFKYSLNPQQWIRTGMFKHYSQHINRIKFNSALNRKRK